MQLDVYTKDGKTAGSIELQDDIFGIEPNESAMHRAVVTYLAHNRQGTHSTKSRKDVRGGGKKPWRQKGRGTARAGSVRSPLWKGGGTIHGPQPHTYDLKISKKIKQLAKKSALSTRVAEENLMVVEDFQLDEVKTANMAEILENLKINGEKILILLPESDRNLFLSSRNIPRLSVNTATEVSAYDLLNHKRIVLFKGAVETLVSTFNN